MVYILDCCSCKITHGNNTELKMLLCSCFAETLTLNSEDAFSNSVNIAKGAYFKSIFHLEIAIKIDYLSSS